MGFAFSRKIRFILPLAADVDFTALNGGKGRCMQRLYGKFLRYMDLSSSPWLSILLAVFCIAP